MNLSYTVSSNAVICKVPLNNEQIRKLHKTSFVQDNVGYYMNFLNDDYTEGYLAWRNNISSGFGKEEVIEFFRIEDYLVLMVSSPKFVSKFKTIINKVLTEVEIEIVKFPLFQIDNLPTEKIKQIIQEVSNVEAGFFIDINFYSVKFNAKENDKDYIISLYSNGEFSFSLGHNKSEWYNVIRKMISINKRMENELQEFYK